MRRLPQPAACSKSSVVSGSAETMSWALLSKSNTLVVLEAPGLMIGSFWMITNRRLGLVAGRTLPAASVRKIATLRRLSGAVRREGSGSKTSSGMFQFVVPTAWVMVAVSKMPMMSAPGGRLLPSAQSTSSAVS